MPHWAAVVRGAGVDVAIDAERAFSGASMIKTFLLALVSADVAVGERGWDDAVVIAPGLRAPGDGVLLDWRLPVTLPLHAACHLMIAISDNTAANAVAAALGGPAVVNDRLAALGCRSRLRRHVGGGEPDPRADGWLPDRGLPSPAGLSVVLPREHADVVDRLRPDPVAWALLRAQQDRRSLARGLAWERPFAHKTGTVDGVRHDGGVLDTAAGAIAAHVFTDGDPARDESVDDPACVAMGRVGAALAALAG